MPPSPAVCGCAVRPASMTVNASSIDSMRNSSWSVTAIGLVSPRVGVASPRSAAAPSRSCEVSTVRLWPAANSARAAATVEAPWPPRAPTTVIWVIVVEA